MKLVGLLVILIVIIFFFIDWDNKKKSKKNKATQDKKPKPSNKSLPTRNRPTQIKKSQPEKTVSKIENVNFSTKQIKLTFDPEKLSKYTKDYETLGSSGNKYIVRMDTVSCTCKDFVDRRSAYPEFDIRRSCKHIVRRIIDLKLNTKISNEYMSQYFVRKYAKENKGISIYTDFLQISINEEIKGPNPFYVFFWPDEFEWASIYTSKEKGFKSCGFHLIEKRWGWHENPFPAGWRRKYNYIMSELADNKSKYI